MTAVTRHCRVVSWCQLISLRSGTRRGSPLKRWWVLDWLTAPRLCRTRAPRLHRGSWTPLTESLYFSRQNARGLPHGSHFSPHLLPDSLNFLHQVVDTVDEIDTHICPGDSHLVILWVLEAFPGEEPLWPCMVVGPVRHEHVVDEARGSLLVESHSGTFLL